MLKQKFSTNLISCSIDQGSVPLRRAQKVLPLLPLPAFASSGQPHQFKQVSIMQSAHLSKTFTQLSVSLMSSNIGQTILPVMIVHIFQLGTIPFLLCVDVGNFFGFFLFHSLFFFPLNISCLSSQTLNYNSSYCLTTPHCLTQLLLFLLRILISLLEIPQRVFTIHLYSSVLDLASSCLNHSHLQFTNFSSFS